MIDTSIRNDQLMLEQTVPPLAIYAHFPWCVRKCPYCDFNSHQMTGEGVPEERYLGALLKDLQLQASTLSGRSVESVFLGGGTPSLFSPAAIGRLLDAIRAQFDCAVELEVTLEANPGTIERGRFAEYHAAGVSRVSLGGQSFNVKHLQALGRIHSSDETRAAAEELHAAGLTNFNIDLMYGLPEQTPQQAEDDVRTAIALSPAHLSHYQLTLEPGTAFSYRPPLLPNDDRCWEMQMRCQTLLAEHGFAQYEISAYASANNQCRHNLNYWQFGDYLGIGAGAHGKLTQADGSIHRTTQPRQPRRYMEQVEEGHGQPDSRPVPQADLPFEFMLNALRLVEGWDQQLFETRTGLDLATVGTTLQSARTRGLLENLSAHSWRPTPLGLRFLNDLQGLFLPTASAATKP